MQRPQGRRRGKAAEELILRTVAANADSLLRTARRHSLCLDDAQDAYQRALEIFMVHAERLDGGNAAGWLHVVVKREAQAVRASRQKLVSSEEVNLDDHEARSVPTPDERLAAFDLVGRAAEALQRLKPQELRALWLKAEGHSYNEIAELTGWSYTKVNRCLTEGRRSFLARYATIESGAECERWLPVLSAMVDGETTPEQLIELRPHLRNCPGCRSTLGALRGSSEPLAMVLPIPLVGAVGGDGEQISNLITRSYELIVGGLHDRAAPAFLKAQALMEATAAGKAAAIAGAAAAVAGGGYATVERSVGSRGADRPSKTARSLDQRFTSHPSRPRVGSASGSLATSGNSIGVGRAARGEFKPIAADAPRSVAPEFTGSYRRSGVSDVGGMDRGSSSQSGTTGAGKHLSAAPEFGSQHSPEFGP